MYLFKGRLKATTTNINYFLSYPQSRKRLRGLLGLSMTETPHISFEFFAAKTEQGRKNLQTNCQKLSIFNPDFFSVTYGAGGSTRDTTKQWS